MVSIRFVSLLVMLAVVASVTAVPAPQFQEPRPVAPGPQPKNLNPDAEQLEGSNDEKDLKGSASYGYGYYGGLGGYGGYGSYGGYGGYPYSYSSYDVYIDSVRVFNESSTVPGYGNCTMKRRRQENPTLSVDMWLTDSLDKYEMQLKVSLSRLGNNRYILLPFKVNRTPVCILLKKCYRKYTMHYLHKFSNAAYSDDPNADYCELSPPGHYWVRDYEFNTEDMVKYAPLGRYRFFILFYKKEEKYSCKDILVEVVIN